MAKKNQESDSFQNLEQATVSSEQFLEKNSKTITWCIIAALVIVAGWLAYRNYVQTPRNAEALSQIYAAERYFAQDSLDLALNGDGNALGMLAVADKYSNTPSGKIANYYAGLAYLYKGEFETAISYLKKYNGKDLFTSTLAKANIGDAYMELGKFAEAAAAYKSAAKSNANDFTTPIILMKQGMACEKAGQYAQAVAAYERIDKEFHTSYEAQSIEKYIARAKANL